MKTVMHRALLAVACLAPFHASIASDALSPPEVLTRLVASASRTPPGPVENDVSAAVMTFAASMAKNFPGGDVHSDPASIRLGIAQEFNVFSIDGPMTSLFSNDSAAIFSAKVKVKAETLKGWEEDKKTEASQTGDGTAPSDHQTGLAFGPGMSQEIDNKIRPDGELIATVGFVKEKEEWKVYCIYFSDGPMEADNRDFLVEKLTAAAKGN